MSVPWESRVLEFFGIDALHQHQRDTIQALVDGKDVFLSVRTGGGKSLCFMSIPVAARAQWESRRCGPTGKEFIFVVSPLNSIMTEQANILISLGLTAVCLGKDKAQTTGVMRGDFQFIFTSPETILGDQFRGLLRSEIFKGHTGLVVIDEAHTVVQWGESSSEGDVPFREWFAKLGELRSLLPGTPLLALTATASKKRRHKIQKLLSMQGCKELIDNPDRDNIKLHVKQVESSAELADTFDWMLSLLKKAEHGANCPRILIFCKSIDDCSKLYSVCKYSLSKESMKHVDMFHSQTPEKTKNRIREDMADDTGRVRILICTTAAGMGVNYAGVNSVVNYGPPQEMDTLLQQQGRAGRTGQQAHHLLIYNNRQLRNLDVEVLDYVRNNENVCRRQIMLSHYSAVCNVERTLHTCCDVCSPECKCDSPECDQCLHIALTLEESHSDSESGGEQETVTQLSTQQHHALKLSLEQYQDKLNEDTKTESLTAQPEVIHGFTSNTIDLIINNCGAVKSSDDVLAKCGVWTYDQAKTVYVIICSVLEVDSDERDSDLDYMGLDD